MAGSALNITPKVKLEGANYRQWKEHILITLAGINARRIVMGEELAPANNATQLRESFQSRCEQAAHLLHRSCGVAAASHIKGIFEPTEIWRILDRQYGAGRNFNSLIPLITRFDNLRMPADMKTAGEFIALMRDFQNELAHTRHALTDERLLSHLLSHLPQRYESTVERISELPIEQQTLEIAGEKLRAAEDLASVRKEVIGGGQDAATRKSANALSSTSSHHGKKGNSGGKFNHGGNRVDKNSDGRQSDKANSKKKAARGGNRGNCFYCKQPGHFKLDCRIRKRDEGNNNQDGNAGAGSGANVALVDDYFEEVHGLPATVMDAEVPPHY